MGSNAVIFPRGGLDVPGPVVSVPVGSLRTAGSPRSTGENLEHVMAMAGTQDELPPIVVHRGTMRVVDGRHRLLAARLRGQRRIAVRFFDGGEADAFVFAVRANVAHGLPLSLADRKAAAARIVETHPGWSDRLIASVTGLSGKTVGAIRRAGSAAAGSRVGRDGRARPNDIGERRRLAGRLMSEDPGLSLRQVARAVGISPETARSVRAGLRAEVTDVAGDPARWAPVEERQASGADGPQPERADGVGSVPVRLPVPQPRAGTPDDSWAEILSGNPDRVPAEVGILRRDPSLRFTDSGRKLLRLLDAASGERWAGVVDEVPVHCRPTVARVAMECARFWQSVAERLQTDVAA